MNADPIILKELYVSVSVEKGIKIRDYKYRVKQTKQNYIKYDDSEENYNLEKGFSGPLQRRIGVDELMKVGEGRYDSHDKISRSVWYLEGDEKVATDLLRHAITEQLTIRKENANQMMETWLNR